MLDARLSDVSDDSCRPPRTIVLCFDGTRGQYDSTNTNVVKFFGLLRKDCPYQQVAYYQPGIGTYFAPGVVSPLFSRLASLLDEAVAWYLDAHVMGGYKFLMGNYRAGDKICLFGFSRGAYTARALAGMLDKVGLLPSGNLQQVGFAYKAYTRTDEEGVKLAAGFKQTFSQNVKIDFLGVWDTVQSTGVLVSRALPFTSSNNAVRVFRHALSLDEHRARFRPNLCHWPTQVIEANEMAEPENAATQKFAAVKATFKKLLGRKNRSGQPYQKMDHGPGTFTHGIERNAPHLQPTSDTTRPQAKFVAEESPTDVLEVWFSGCHSDIGGGNVQDDVCVSLAQIPLHWMVEHAMQSHCGIVFDSNELARIGFTIPSSPTQLSPTSGQILPTAKTNCVAPVATDVKTTADVVVAVQESPNETNQPTLSPGRYDEHANATAPLYDQLNRNLLWWILEILPVSNVWQDDNGVWHSNWSINLGKGRLIPYQKPKFHHTVKQRMDHGSLNYKPRATHDHNEVYV